MNAFKEFITRHKVVLTKDRIGEVVVWAFFAFAVGCLIGRNWP